MSAPKRKNNEIWLIDYNNLVLYRVISDDKEQAIPIHKNVTMERFMCLDKDEVKAWLEEAYYYE